MNRHNSQTYWKKSIADKIQWFCFHYGLTHAEKKTKEHHNQKPLK